MCRRARPVFMQDLDAARWALPAGLAARLVTPPDADASLLTPTERARVAGFALADRRRQFVLGRVAAHTLAAERLGAAPPDVPLAVGADGAPEVAGLSVSIAHTGRGERTAALAAVANVPVGVDLEWVAPRRPTLWTRILADEERPVLDALGGPTDDTQTLLWTLKEAVLKGQRTGFRAPAASVRLALDADGAPPDQGWATATAGSGAWHIAFGRDDDLWLAVAWQATPPAPIVSSA